MGTASLEGPVSRYLNRRLSEPLARLLTPTPVSPNQVSVLAAAVALGVVGGFAIGQAIAAGLLIQVSSIIDGVGGDLTRMRKQASRFGAVMDSALRRYADVAIVGGMTWWAWSHPGVSGPQPFVVGLAALTGFLLLSYSRAALEMQGYGGVLSGPALFATRDVRLLLAAAGSFVGQTYWTLVVLGALSYLVVVWTMWLAYRRREAASGRPFAQA